MYEAERHGGEKVYQDQKTTKRAYVGASGASAESRVSREVSARASGFHVCKTKAAGAARNRYRTFETEAGVGRVYPRRLCMIVSSHGTRKAGAWKRVLTEAGRQDS